MFISNTIFLSEKCKQKRKQGVWQATKMKYETTFYI